MNSVDPRIRRVLALMERHRARPLAVAELARAVNLSSAHLTRLFRADLGQSPARVRRELALEHARDLLLTTFLSVKQVMGASGWSDPSHFCREFKRRHGVSPLVLRLRARIGPRTSGCAHETTARPAAYRPIVISEQFFEEEIT